VGGVPDRLGAVLAGKVQGAILNPPASFVGQKKGLNILADVSKLGLAFQYTGVATSRRFTREHPDIVRRYVRSQIEAVNRIHTDKDTSLKVLTKYFGGNVERDILEKSWELLADENMLPKKQVSVLGRHQIYFSSPVRKRCQGESSQARRLCRPKFYQGT
jgi:ABC-type nitrate/sulfonate/bicarbonate transport system substrate-binding protein